MHDRKILLPMEWSIGFEVAGEWGKNAGVGGNGCFG